MAEAAFSGTSAEAAQMLTDFWPNAIQQIRNLTNNDFKNQELPLARIKKIMKLDEDVKMISAEAPVLFAKAAEIFICELSLRAWIHTEDNKRRTLQRNDIAMAISKFDQFDFLIDIVPRDELKPAKRQEETVRASSSLPDQIQYYLQMPVAVPQTVQVPQVVTQPAQQVVTQQAAPIQQTATIQLPGGQIIQPSFQIQNVGGQPQIVQLQTPQTSMVQQQLSQVQQVHQVMSPAIQQQAQTAVVSQLPAQVATPVVQPTTQVFQQVITPTGEVQNIPIQLTPQQLQSIQMQLQGKTSAQSIVIQSSQPVQAQPDQMAQLASQPIYQLQGLPVGQQGQQIYIQQATAAEGEGEADVQEAA
ncbi:hypothetical protein BaRGS_00006598 [Batillaria attramentaria]|uniref:Nuclear transcription factor Y subunit gamma n=1 Tax=Batillaria attramentaria TaxID=370345 RepID=A0ABD0LRA1_9CAEN